MSTLIGRQAPEFTSPTVMPNNSIDENFSLASLKGKYVVLFFYPLDFTFVCPTEIIGFDKKLGEFKERGVEVVGVSVIVNSLTWRGRTLLWIKLASAKSNIRSWRTSPNRSAATTAY